MRPVSIQIENDFHPDVEMPFRKTGARMIRAYTQNMGIDITDSH